MDLHVRRNASDTGYVAYDDNGHSAGGATENEALIAFHDKWPEVELAGVDIADEAVDVIGTPEEQARHQALLDGVAEPLHTHGPNSEVPADIAMAMQYINQLAGRVDEVAARVEAMDQMFTGTTPAEPEPAPSAAEAELATLKQSLVADWRNFVFKPSQAELMLISIIPLLRLVTINGPTPQTLNAINQWMASIAEDGDALAVVGVFLLNINHEAIPTDVSAAIRRIFASYTQ